MESSTPNVETLREVHTRLTSASSERPNEELKSYALTDANAKAYAQKLAETIAGIANHGYSFGYVVCTGGASEGAIIDGARLDDLITKYVHPRVLVTLHREEIDAKVVDFVIVPKSALRPHLMRIDDGRYVVPFRGIANNTGAARTELDHIYRERTIDMMRSAFPGLEIGEQDTIGKYLDRIQYGLGQSDKPQIAFTIVPQSIPKRLVANDDLLGTAAARQKVFNLSTDAINADYNRHKDWFSVSGGLVFYAREDYLEILQASRGGEYLWGARAYDTGTITYSSVIYPAEFSSPPGALPLFWFKNMASATLTFAHLVYDALNVPVDAIAVRALVKDAQNLRLREWGRFEIPRDGNMIDPNPFVLIPTHEPIWTTRTVLKSDTPKIVEELGRVLSTRFDMPVVI